jgi:phosphopentomutase
VTRKFLDEGGDYTIGRVIARPFTGEVGAFVRTSGRKDFTIEPPGETVLDLLKKRGIPVTAIGKIGDIFSGSGITEEIHTKSNAEGIEKTVEVVRAGTGDGGGLVFTNLVDFDMDYGHRNDPAGYARCLEEADRGIAELMGVLGDGDMLIITADHGCDPTTPSTDHSREYVPLIVYGKGLKGGVDLGTRESFADLGATVAEVFSAPGTGAGTSFLAELLDGAGSAGERSRDARPLP